MPCQCRLDEMEEKRGATGASRTRALSKAVCWALELVFTPPLSPSRSLRAGASVHACVTRVSRVSPAFLEGKLLDKRMRGSNM
jgi:hypothetical protein